MWTALNEGCAPGGGGGGLPNITDGDARQNFQKKPLKVTKLGVTPAILFPKSYLGNFHL